MRFVFKIILVVFTCTLLFNCEKQKQYNTANYKIDSITMRKKYNENYTNNLNGLNKIHSLYMQENDSVLLGINHQLYSNYLSKNNKFDSAYYYLTLANNFFKGNERKQFFNSIRKIALTNRIGLLTHSKAEIKIISNSTIQNKNLQQLYITVFSLPITRQEDSLKYLSEINYFINAKGNLKKSIERGLVLENYLTGEINKYLIRKQDYDKIIVRSNKRINELLKEKKTNEDVFFTHLFYNIYAKTIKKDTSIYTDFAYYEKNLNNASTKETQVLYYYLKAKYYEKNSIKDSVIVNFSKALQISKETDNFMYEHDILEQLILTNSSNLKAYMNDFIRINDSLLSYKNYIDDFIFTTNSNSLTLKSEQQSILKRNLNITAFTFLLFFSIVLCYFFYRNIKVRRLARERRIYLAEKAKMYKYLIEIKEQMDATILKENNHTKQLIYNNTIAKIDDLLINFNNTNPNFDLLQSKIKDIEDEARNISHIISSTNYTIVDLGYIINDIKKQYAGFIKIETFIDNTITLNDLEFKTLLRIMLFTYKFIDKIKYKEGLTCFISIYRTKKKRIYKIWINKQITLNDELFTFLDDRSIKFEIKKEKQESTFLIYFN